MSGSMQENRLRTFMKTLKCSLCNNFLSIPPIITISHDETQQKCGRCEDIPTEFAVRNYSFENLVEIAKFPCMYRECEEIIPWGEVRSHEEDCIHRTLKCPMFRTCQETVEVRYLLSHFEEKHAENLTNSVSDEPVQFDTYKISMLVSEHGQYLIARYFTTGTFWIKMFSLYPEANCDYELILNCHNPGQVSSSFRSRVVTFKENDHCFKCFIGECHEKSHKNSTLYSQSPLYLSNTSLAASLDINTLRATINIIPIDADWEGDADVSEGDAFIAEGGGDVCEGNADVSEGDADVSERAIPTNKNTSLIDRILQCPVCADYMIPPIFTCSAGHSICNMCRPRVEICPTCRLPFGTARNFILEDVSDNAELFCQWQYEGCNFSGNALQLSLHHNDCEFDNK